MKHLAAGDRTAEVGAVLASICAVSVPASSASAETFSSSYTSTAPKDCRVNNSRIRVCPGKAGLVVLINEDDLREIVSVGRDRGRHRA